MKRFFFVFLMLLSVKDYAGSLPEEPTQPKFGPGGANCLHQRMTITRINAYEDKFYLFEPDLPRPAKAPVVIFLHGWTTSHPEFYEGWIRHLCLRGAIVIFPCFMDMGEPIERFTVNAIRSLKEAFHLLLDGKHVEPDRDRVFLIGHEAGAVVGANVAALSGYFKIPGPKALMLLMPSRSPGGETSKALDLADLTRIKEGTLMLIGVGEDDFSNGEDAAREIFYAADSLYSRDKNFLTFLTDMHGTPAQVGDQWAPLSPIQPRFRLELDRRRYEFIRTFKNRGVARFVRGRPIDAMDFLGFWRLFDALNESAVTGKGRLQVLGNTPEQRFMGYWSDGKPVRGILADERP